MKLKRTACSLAFALLSLAPAFAHHMAVIVNKDNSVGNLSSAHLAKILHAETQKWPDGKDVVLVLHKSLPGEVITLERLNKMTRQAVDAFISSHKDSVRLVDSDSDVLDAVQSPEPSV